MTMEQLEPLLGEWAMEATFDGLPGDAEGRVTFEWMPGEAFLVQRWEVSHPEAPDGIAIIGPSPRGEGYLQHYFDSRGVARVYEMTFDGGTWTLERDTDDFSPLDFAQRFRATVSEDGTTIAGAWELRLEGRPWEHDFDLTYTRVR